MFAGDFDHRKDKGCEIESNEKGREKETEWWKTWRERTEGDQEDEEWRSIGLDDADSEKEKGMNPLIGSAECSMSRRKSEIYEM